MVGDETDRRDEHVLDAPSFEVVEVPEDVGAEPLAARLALALEGD